MKKAGIIFNVIIILTIYSKVLAQTSPYQIPPKWMFGYGAGFDFGTSPFTNSPPLVLTGNPTNNGGGNSIDAVGGMEASSAICDPNSNLLLYTNFFRYYNYPANTGYNFPGTAPSGSGSSTDGGVILPDPANPSTQFYIFVANDITGSAAGVNKGINYYKVSLPINASSVTGPTNLVNSSMVDEALCTGSDGNGGYWIIAHGRASSNGSSFLVWHVTSSGVSAISTQAAPNPGAPFPAPANNNNIGAPTATIKINRCQDKIAYVTGSFVEVYEWNRNTGTIGNVLYRQFGIACCASYGLEFSPDGNYVYFSELNGALKRIDVVSQTGTPITIANGSVNPSCSELGTMQLGPDGKIYVTNCANATNNEVYVGVINNPNNVNCNYVGKGVQLKPANTDLYPSISRGIANMGWMSPNKPSITLASGGTCSSITHTINFTTYFNSPIEVLDAPLSSIQWSFDNGLTWQNGNGTNSITHDYGGSVTTTVMVRFFDKSCGNYEWTASASVVTSCTTPVCDAPAALAGADIKLCNTTSTALQANNAGTGNGTWSVISGTGNVQSINDRNSLVNNLVLDDTLTLRWTISKSGCSSTFDEVEIITYSQPIASVGQDISVCEGSVVTLNASTPVTGTGNWVVLNNTSVQLVSSNDPVSQVIGLPIGDTYLQWQVSNGMCTVSVEDLKVSILALTPDAAIIGNNVNLCTNTFDLNANSPGNGINGVWHVIEGSGSIIHSTNNLTTVNDLSDGINRITWTLSGACGVSDDTIEINVGSGSFTLSGASIEDTLCFDKTTEVELSVSGSSFGTLTYYWMNSGIRSDTISSTNKLLEIKPDKEGWFHYTAFAIDEGQCKSFNEWVDSVYFVKEQQFMIPNLLTPNKDLLNDCLMLFDENGFNPLDGSAFYLYNRWGQMVYKNSNYYNGSFCPEDLSDGVYFYTLEPSCGTSVKGWLNIISSSPQTRE